ncbi:MAG: BlaI/MecI/CopY family transcriptional regulator [Armatimonadetes bacterium]|nr:BlaI/MecI/CopY family transcriptional regulator [Armatimonadota bacterium]
MRKKPTVGKAEFALLAHVAQSDGLSVGEIYGHFESEAGYSRSTITQMLERLRKKKFLKRRKESGMFVYRSVKPYEELQSEMIEGLVTDVLDGSVSPLVHFLQKKVKLTKAEEKELKKILKRIEEDS